MRRLALIALALAALVGCSKSRPADAPLRLGYFPNITHAQALVGADDGTFKKALGDRKLELKKFNAGPAAMEALLAGDVDVTYVGASPAIVAYYRSEGRVKVISGAASGGAGLVVHPDAIPDAKALIGQQVASPQVGNTQDVALRHWLVQQGIDASDRPGRQVQVIPINNSEAFGLFKQGRIHAAWVPEPWLSRMIREGNGTLLIDERTLWPDGVFPTTVLVASEEALKNRRGDLEAIVRANAELTARAASDPDGFRAATNAAFEKLTQKKLSNEVLADAFSRIAFTTDPMAAQLIEVADQLAEVGYLPKSDVSGIVDPSFNAKPANSERAKARRSPR